MLSWWRRQRMMNKVLFVYVVLGIVFLVWMVYEAATCQEETPSNPQCPFLAFGVALLLWEWIVGFLVLSILWFAWWLMRRSVALAPLSGVSGVRPGSWLFAAAVITPLVALPAAFQTGIQIPMRAAIALGGLALAGGFFAAGRARRRSFARRVSAT